MDQPRFVLKTTPPRAHRMAVARPRLDKLWSEIHERTLTEVCAPRGFGKSTLLVQWRRRWLERGALVAWVTLDGQDTPIRFARVVAHALRVASGRAVFDRVAVEFGEELERALEAMTAVLSEVANLATPTVIMLDDGEQLPAQTAENALPYLLINAPANLQIVLGSRVPLPLPTVELSAHGNLGRLTTEDLRFDLEESVALLNKRFGKRLELDDCVRLHEMTDGWPIGLQLAAAAIERSPHYQTAVRSLSARDGDIERYFIESLLERLPPPVVAFLTRIAILDPVVPELCGVLTQAPEAQAWLEQIMADTPIMTVTELRGSIRLHSLARDFLMSRFERLPSEEQTSLHRRAAAWLAERGQFPEASRHAHATGDVALVQTYAAQTLWGLGVAGRLSEAQQWLDRLSPESIAADVKLRLISAWIMAFSDRVEEARQIAGEALNDPALDLRIAFVAALVASCAEGCIDRVGFIPPLLQRWPEPPAETSDPAHALAYANTRALVALHEGDLAYLRALDTPAPATTSNSTVLLACAISRMLAAAALLRDADPQSAESMLHPALVHAERTLGRRSIVACLHAVCMGAALYERNEIARAAAALAHRIDVIERCNIPDAIVIGYQTLARLAVAQGDERRAFTVLESLHTLGVARRMPRMRLGSVAMQIELHAQRGRAAAAEVLLAELDALGPAFEYPEYQPFLAEFRFRRSLARAYVALSKFDAAGADADLARAAEVARASNRARDAMTVQVLRAVAADFRRSEDAQTLLGEALSLAAMRGCLRVAEDTHPRAVEMRDASAHAASTPAVATAVQAIARTSAQKIAVAPGGLLTPKESNVLRLLAAGQSNKHIAQAMDISDETVKWHLKNLFSKLSAGTRKHAVDRARMMGLVVDDVRT